MSLGLWIIISEEAEVKEEDPIQREGGNKNANEASNEVPNKYLPIMKYETLTDLTNSSKKKIEKELLKCLALFFVFSDNSFAVKAFPIHKN